MAYQKAVVAVYLIINKGNSTLLYLRQNTSYFDGYYSLIAGHVEDDESITEAIIREAKEEADIIITQKNLKPICSLQRKSDSIRVDFFFELVNYKGKIINKEPNKCKELKFFDIDNLPENTIDYIKSVLVNTKPFPFEDFGWEVASNN